MADDDSDLDIEDLIKGLEMEEPAGKQIGSTPLAQPGKSNLKDPGGVTKDAKPSETPSSQQSNLTAQSKSVRFSHDIPDSTGTLNQKRPSSMLSNMFFPEGDPETNPKQSESNPQQQQQPKNVQKNDWLGLGDDEDESMPMGNLKLKAGPSEVPVLAYRNPVNAINKPVKPSGSTTLSQRRPSFDDFDENDLMRLLDSKSPSTSSIPLESKAKSEEPLLRKLPLPVDSIKNTRKPDPVPVSSVLPLGPRSISPSPQFSLGRILDKPESALYNSTGGMHQSPEGGSLLSSLNTMQESTKLIQQNRSQTVQPPSFLDALPFLKQKVQENPPGDGQAPANTGQGAVKKKSVVSKVAGTASTPTVHTLQLPSHLVNEEELKTMSSSLKTLYGNQLEMLESSYKEQMEFLSVSNKRKEDLLKDEMSALQGDYDQRIQRLRAELIENETRNPHKVHEDISSLSTHFDKLSSQLETLKVSTEFQNRKMTEMDFNDVTKGLSKELERLLKMELTGVTENIQTSLHKEMRQTIESYVSQSVSEQSRQFQELKSKLDDVTGTSGHKTSELIRLQLEEAENVRQVEFQKLLKVQKKLKENAVNSALTSVTKLFDASRENDLRKRDRLAFQVKEFRKDLRRLYIELDSKNDSVHKSQLSMELEQRSITQAIRDINTILKVTSVNQNSGSNVSNQFAAMHAVHQQSQNEMEIKLLREERGSLSESIAELNVERRKLTDEKFSFERDKLEFEREKVRIREIEMKSKARLTEAEDLKRNAEAVRLQEAKLSGEAESKLQEMAKERSKMKDRVFEIEQKLIIREQKLFHEKSELIREKEFVDKLRDQLLCPGCLNSLNGISSLGTLAPPPYFQQMRSDGDGVDFGVGEGGSSSRMFQQMPRINLTPAEDAYFRKESKYLEDLDAKTF